jgi:transcriptional regulator with XRE-family HTH domain
MVYTTEPRDDRAVDGLIWLGEAVRKARIARGLSQRHLARMCALDQGSISRLENGKAPGMRIESLGRILRVVMVLDVRPPYVVPPYVVGFDRTR